MIIGKILAPIYLRKKIFFFLKIFGIKGAFKALINYLKTRQERLSTYEYYFISDFDKEKKFQEKEISSKQLRINWIIPDIIISGGGHKTLFRLIGGLEKLGHTNEMYIMTNWNSCWGTAKNAKRIISKYYVDLNTELFEGTNNMKASDVCIATDWRTAYPLYKIQNTKKKIYFVQDYECDFYPKSSAYFFAEQTYRMGYKCITAEEWLTRLLREKYGLQCGYFNLVHNPQIYRVDEDMQRSSNTVVFYARYPAARRGFELGVLALQEVARRKKDINIVFFGCDCTSLRIPLHYKNLGNLSEQRLAKLYNQATVGVVFSLTGNQTLVSQEMMACGLPVVDIKGDYTEYVYPRDVIALANTDPNSIAETILFLLNNEEERSQLQKNALHYIKDLRWEEQIKKVENLIFNL